MDAIFAFFIQGNEYVVKGRTGWVTHQRTWRLSRVSCLTARLAVTLGEGMLVICSRPFLLLTQSFTMRQMHVRALSETALHVLQIRLDQSM